MLAISAQAFLEGRKLDLETASRMGVRFEGNRLEFLYTKAGQNQFSKVRSMVEKRFWLEPSGVPLQLWNLDSLPEPIAGQSVHETLVITEGELDAIAVCQSIPGCYVVSVPNGASGQKTEGEKKISEDTAFRWLWTPDNRLLPQIAQFTKIVLAVDGDDKGMTLRDELAIRLGETKCWFVTYPGGAKDANDVLMNAGGAGVRGLIGTAKPMRPGFMVKPSELPPAPNYVAFSTGWGCLDDHFRLVRPELIVVTGEPGYGKSVWTRALCCHLALAHGWRSGLLTPEDPGHRVARDLRRFAKANVGCRDDTSANHWIDRHFRISRPPEDEPITMDYLLTEIETAALHHGCHAFVLDPWNEILHDYGRASETDYTARVLTELKRKTRKLNLALIIVAHPRKITSGVTPDLYDISGSAHWRNKADHGIVIHRESAVGDTVSINVRKSKDQETMGKPGEVYMVFNREASDFAPVAPPERKDYTDV